MRLNRKEREKKLYRATMTMREMWTKEIHKPIIKMVVFPQNEFNIVYTFRIDSVQLNKLDCKRCVRSSVDVIQRKSLNFGNG